MYRSEEKSGKVVRIAPGKLSYVSPPISERSCCLMKVLDILLQEPILTNTGSRTGLKARFH